MYGVCDKLQGCPFYRKNETSHNAQIKEMVESYCRHYEAFVHCNLYSDDAPVSGKHVHTPGGRTPSQPTAHGESAHRESGGMRLLRSLLPL